MVTANLLLSVFFLSGALAACRKDLPLFITAPQNMEALTGSCLQIPCNFSARPGKMSGYGIEITGVWIKNDPRFENRLQNVIFNGSKTVNEYPMNITGNLNQRNCTTLFSSLITNYTDTYYFRIETRPFIATAICDPLHITVKDSPTRPRIEISGELKEAESVTITCSALTPCPHSPPKLTWNLQQDLHNKIEENTDGTFTTKIQETITLSDRRDGYNITCSARYPVNEGRDVKTAEGKKTLNVSYAPKDTSASISPSGLVSAGSWVNLTCSSRANPPVSRFTWFKKSTGGDLSVSEGAFYTFNVTDKGVYYCVATNDVGNQMSTEIHLSVKGESLPWGPVLGGIVGIIVLVCLIVCLIVCVCWLKSTRPTARQTQSRTGEEPAVAESTRKTEEDDDIHYGEIIFSERRPEPSSASLQDSGPQEDMVYAQVKVSKKADRSTETADGLEDLYAQVKKK
ncbi:myelin-associated glycoprotein-like [Seriola lalandi dorsalis]|uniref:myelin-associated glycoprotein-like n=1 Tax=Seriola lalandi dorsalis TaxID=1841481 RepID=UPI000C6FB59C|nr:myelin-associated glycoprotein-like [Seriola lalandi dorsalis]